MPLVAGMCGCGSAVGGEAGKTITAVKVTPSTASVATSASQQFTATATYSDGSTANISGTATWTATNSSIATVNPSGMATAVAAGSTTITATQSGVSGSATLTVTASAPTLASIAVTPAAPSIAAGATQQFTATGTYSDGTTGNITSTVTWVSGNTSVATITTAGLATGVSSGSATITASLSGVRGNSMLTVSSTAPSLTSIAVTPSAPSIAAGATQQFTATGTYSDGTTGNITSTVTWVSGNTKVATITAAGLATGVASGSASITASLNGVSGSATLTVTSSAPTLTSIAVTPATPSITAGATQQFTATGTYSDGTTKNITNSVNWTSSNTSAATINGAGLATGVAAGSSTITASSGGVSGTAMLTVTANSVTSIAVTPNPATFAAGSTQQFTATATYSNGTTQNVTSTATWTSSNTSAATIDSSGLATGVAAGTTTITATINTVSGTSSATVTAASTSGVNITTWHVDNNRSGLNSQETELTPTTVGSTGFGKLFSYLVDGYAYAEPLIVSNLRVNGATHNVLFVATEHDSVYAFDADSGNQTPLWQTSLLESGETPLTNAPIQPYQGITGTPVIDTGTNTLYVVSVQKGSSGNTFRLNALDITTGKQKTGSPVTITASLPGTNTSNGIGNGTTVTLNASCMQRAALLEANGNIYIGIGSCPTGWLLAYNATTLAQVGVFNASPNLAGEGEYASAGGVWMGSGGPVADSSGNVYITTGNGPWDGKTAWSDSVLKFPPTPTSGSNGTMQPEDYFTPSTYQYMDCADSDLAAGGLMLIPGSTTLVAGGKMGKLYLTNSGNLGHEDATDSGAEQELWFEADLSAPYQSNPCKDANGNTYTAEVNAYQIYGTSAYFNGYVYLGISQTGSSTVAPVRQFKWDSSALTLTPGAYTSPNQPENTRGTTPFISSNGSSDGIVWMINQGVPLQQGTPTAATLYAYDAQNFPNVLYSSANNSADTAGYAIKFTSPVVANGKVYMSTGHDNYTASHPQGEIDVYGMK
ncbi:MAG: Ig-like domain-containing protein [Acidobacteriaceae bacterium]